MDIKKNFFSDSEILNGLNWTASLDEIFKENWRNDPNLRWQYFGSFFGFMRVYPAFRLVFCRSILIDKDLRCAQSYSNWYKIFPTCRWPDHPSLPDLFDVRRRSWYIQGSVTPKDVIILIDR